MALSFSLPRGLFLFAFLPLFHLSGSIPAFAQDTGTATAGSTNYQKAQVGTILDLYEQLSGKHLIRDASLDSGAIPLISINATGLNKIEMMNLIQETLLLNGVAFVPVDEHNLKVIAVGANKNPRTEGVKLYANAADLPTEDQVVTYYMPLDYINPQEAAGIFNLVAPVHNGYGQYVVAPSAQAVILTENVSVIRELIALKELIDAPTARVTSEWIQLNRANSDDTALILNKMLGLGPNGVSTTPPGPGGPVFVPASLGNSSPLSNEKNLISGPAQILSDPRSNRLLVITRPVNMPFLEQMITQLDQQAIFIVPQRRALKYVLAQDILPALEAAIAQGKDEEDQARKDATSARTNTPGQTTGGTAAPTTTSTAGTTGGGAGSAGPITPQLQAPNQSNAPSVVIIGNTRLMADNLSNSILVFGTPDIDARVFSMIDQLDRKPLQVYLATVIGELTVSQGEEFGVDLLMKYQKIGQGGIAFSNLNSSQSTGTAGASFLPEPKSLMSSTGFPILSGLSLYGAIGSTLNYYVKALETTDRFKIISRPSVYTTNNNLAVIASGSDVPVPSSTTSGFTGGVGNQLTTTSSITYQDVLLQLDIVPLINADKEVTLKIRQTNNTLGANNNISGNEVPTINTQEINTEVTVPDKSTVVIGGLISDQTTRDTSGVPLLSDIPVLGYLFKDTTKNKMRSELIIMIEPTVVESATDQIAVDDTERQRTILGHDTTAGVSDLGPLPQPALAPRVDLRSVTVPASYNSKTGASTTTTTVTVRAPQAEIPTGPIPPSSPAPNVSNGQMPKYPAPLPPTTP
ncbi:MAG: hypothetical protein LV480_11245 [Methylacidiphilales bacterium]|nr:hypothetical protein [Candidatus Methylacidiphilales bacterium]